MKILRTPDARFENLEDYPFAPNYTTIETQDGSELRIHHIDEGPTDGPLVLCMHGQPVWSYLYRKMIPYLTAAGMRVIAPDLVGYGKSDKPAAREDYSYERQVEWMGAWLEANELTGITFFGQDWGGLIGLRLVANHPDRFDRVVISNTGLPYNPDVPEAIVNQIEDFRANRPTPTLAQMQKALSSMGEREHAATKFAYWQKFCWENEDMPIGFLMSMMMEQHSNVTRAVRSVSAAHRGRPLAFPDPARPGLRRAVSRSELQDGTAGDAQPRPHAADVAVAGAASGSLAVFRDVRQNRFCARSPTTIR